MNITKEKLQEIAEELYAEAVEDVKDKHEDENARNLLLTIYGASIKTTQEFIEKVIDAQE